MVLSAVRGAVGPLVGELAERYRDHGAVVNWLDHVERELVARTLAEQQDGGGASDDEAAAAQLQALGLVRREGDPYAVFEVNAFVHHPEQRGAPVVAEINPTCTSGSCSS